MLTFHAEDLEAVVVFPGGVALELSLAGKTIDVQATVDGRRALLRTGLEATPTATLDIIERRGPEE